MALEVLVTRYFQMAALGADKRPVREGNHRHELLAKDTIRTPDYSLRHRCNSAGSKGQKRITKAAPQGDIRGRRGSRGMVGMTLSLLASNE